VHRHGLPPPLILHFLGEWVLVTAAAGGVGMAAVQLAKGARMSYWARRSHEQFNFEGLGAKVIGAAGSQEKLDIVKKYGGADYTVDYTKKGWQQEVLKITNGRGVDVIYDPVVSASHTAFLIAVSYRYDIGHDHRFV
jgi:NADPH:quinone reductase-like Zn-dependent oxidoreductase